MRRHRPGPFVMLLSRSFPYTANCNENYINVYVVTHTHTHTHTHSGVPRNFVRRGGSTNSVEDRGQRERGSGGVSPLVRGSGGSCNLVQEISFHIVKFS